MRTAVKHSTILYKTPWLSIDYWKQWEKCSKLNLLYYTSLFRNVGIGEYYLKDCLGLVCAVANELKKKRVDWANEIYPESENICGDIRDKDVFNQLVKLHKEKGCTGVLASPPCQSYTLSNTKRNPSDDRGLLFEPMLELLRVTGLPDDYPIPEWASDKLIRDVIGEAFVPLHVLEICKNLRR